MNYISTRSPFENVIEDEEWVMWQAQTPLYSLVCDKETDSRYVDNEIDSATTERADELNQLTHFPSFQRNQYNAILSKINMASKRAGSFSAWNT